MGRFVERRWEGDPGAYGPRKARASFVYRAFVPDPIKNIAPALTFETHALIGAAEAAVVKLNAGAHDPAAGPGRVRTEQSWIGGRVLTSPYDARSIPPPEDEVDVLLTDPIDFVNSDDLPAVARSAIAHASSRSSRRTRSHPRRPSVPPSALATSAPSKD